jgi:hypothetical protein
MIKIEISKIFQSKFLRILLFTHSFIYPSTSLLFAYLDHRDPLRSDLEIFHQLAANLIAYAQSFFFIPLWIILQVSREFDSGYVSRHVITTSRQDYFKRKITFCLIVSIFFTSLGAVALVSSGLFLDIENEINIFQFTFYWTMQQTVSHFVISGALLAMVIWVRSLRLSLAVYIAWGIVEALTFQLFDKLWGIKLFLLPFHALKLVSSKNGEGGVTNYFNPFFDAPSALVVPILYATVILVLTYQSFLIRDLKPLSD